MKNLKTNKMNKESIDKAAEMVNDRQQELFDYLVNELNTIASQTQMFEVERIVLKIQDKNTYSKQETLEEVAKDFANNSAVTFYEEGINLGKYQGFINGAKWQAQKMYSEEEVMDLFRKYQYDLAQWVLRMEDDIGGKPIPTEWFETFKKQTS
jgi:flagellar biosynthesis/type III secretory pathway protein FliH